MSVILHLHCNFCEIDRETSPEEYIQKLTFFECHKCLQGMQIMSADLQCDTCATRALWYKHPGPKEVRHEGPIGTAIEGWIQWSNSYSRMKIGNWTPEDMTLLNYCCDAHAGDGVMRYHIKKFGGY